MRGARRFDTSDEFHLSLYTPIHWEKPKEIANIVSQQHFRFCDLEAQDCFDNYDEDARMKADLRKAMDNVYGEFDDREVVTILRFQVAS